MSDGRRAEGQFKVEAEVERGRWQAVARGLRRSAAKRIVTALRERRLHPLEARVVREDA